MDRESNSDLTRSHVMLVKGTMVAHYRIVEKIGAGGMGEVYLAEDTRLNRRVALKFLPSHLVSGDEIRSRFVREAQTLAKLNHPNIVSIYDVSEFHGRPYYAMELVEGVSLHRFAHEKPLPMELTIEYAMQICQGLGEAHRAGIVHRDIKASNIIVDSKGRIRILDFGLAAVAGDEGLTRTGSTLGTVSYMSPEQVSGREIDHRSDLFSLGIIIYELIAGRSPFKRDSEGATLKAIIEDLPEPLTRYKSDVPDNLQDIVRKLLEKDKELRYQSAEGVIADLKRLVYDSKSIPESRPRLDSKRPLVYISAFALAALVVAGYFYLMSPASRTRSDNPVLAVLPFTNLGSDEDHYFSEGITDEIRSRLNTLEGVRILSRNSVEKYRDTDKTPDEMGRELGADYLLEGTIRWDKSSEIERLRITPQLIQTSNNYQLWSRSYERTMTQIFAVQAEIADQISKQLGVTLLESGQHRSDTAPTDNLEAYDYYLRGLEMTRKGIFKTSSLREAISMFDSALALDPNFALAWAQKSKATTEYSFGFLGINDPFTIGAKIAAEKALTLDPHLAEGHIALGTYYNFTESDYEKALAEFDLAEPGSDGNADLSEAIGIVKMRQGKWEEAARKYEEAAHIDPLNTRRYYWLAVCYAEMRDFPRANRYINRSYTLAPDNDDAVFLKLFINLLQYGKIEAGEYKFKDITGLTGVARASSWKLSMSNAFGLWRFLPKQYHTGEMIEEMLSYRNEQAEHKIYFNVGELYRLMDMPEISRVYFDSARTLLSHIVQANPADYHMVAMLAVSYARLGMYDEAEAAGRSAKELMSVDDCHW
jgi:serine/threonine protein kinase/Tfp pilus assembly protein PilF